MVDQATLEVEKVKQEWIRIVMHSKQLKEEELLDKYSISIDDHSLRASVIRKKQLKKIKEIE